MIIEIRTPHISLDTRSGDHHLYRQCQLLFRLLYASPHWTYFMVTLVANALASPSPIIVSAKFHHIRHQIVTFNHNVFDNLDRLTCWPPAAS